MGAWALASAYASALGAFGTARSAIRSPVTGSRDASTYGFSHRLNRNYNHDLKHIFKGAAIVAATNPGRFAEFYTELLAKDMRQEMARLTLARKIATIVLIAR